jgi:predicted Zn-dependent protease
VRLPIRLIVALMFALFGFVGYCGSAVDNPITGESQRVSLSPQQEIALGQQATQEIAAQHGGLYPDEALQQYIDQVGERVVQQSVAAQAPYPFEFYLLSDPQTVNAFALPGGPIFITAALLSQLSSEAQLAGVLGHEVGHVVGRHASEQLAKQQLGQALATAVGVAASDSQDGGRQAAVIAQAVNRVVNLQYGREDELESDRLGFQFMTEAGYDPRGIVELMEVLGRAGGSGGAPEFFSTHPNPSNRIERLEALVSEAYPSGVPAELTSGQEEFSTNVLPRLTSGG